MGAPIVLSALSPRPVLACRLTALPEAWLGVPLAALAAAAPAFFAFPGASGVWWFAGSLACHDLGLLILGLRLSRQPARDRRTVITSFQLGALLTAALAISAVSLLGPPGAWALAPLILALALAQGVLSGLLTALTCFGEAVET